MAKSAKSNLLLFKILTILHTVLGGNSVAMNGMNCCCSSINQVKKTRGQDSLSNKYSARWSMLVCENSVEECLTMKQLQAMLLPQTLKADIYYVFPNSGNIVSQLISVA